MDSASMTVFPGATTAALTISAVVAEDFRVVVNVGCAGANVWGAGSNQFSVSRRTQASAAHNSGGWAGAAGVRARNGDNNFSATVVKTFMAGRGTDVDACATAGRGADVGGAVEEDAGIELNENASGPGAFVGVSSGWASGGDGRFDTVLDEGAPPEGEASARCFGATALRFFRIELFCAVALLCFVFGPERLR